MNSLLANNSEAMRAAIQDIAVGPDRGRNLGREHAQQVMSAILAGEADEIQTAVFLIALRMKRESMDEFLGLFSALQKSTEEVEAPVDDLICLADPFDGYTRTISMTPFIPSVLAACGYASVMHGVESVGPKHGVTAHKVYAAAGLNTGLSPVQAAQKIDQAGWTYVGQRQYAPDLFALQSLRDRIVKRTALTTLERLLIPIKGRMKSHLILGYVHKAYPSIYATVAKAAGFDSVLLLKGVEGGLAPALNKPLRQFFFEAELPCDIDAEKQVIETAQMFDTRQAAMSVSEGQEPVQATLDTGIAVLNGANNTARDSLCLASAQILMAHESNLTWSTAVEKVQMCLDNGSAKQCFGAFK